jgi:hypothetical protein
MCDLNTIYGILIGANILMIASIAACGVAIALNLGVFTAGGAPVAFGIALAAGLGANIALLPVVGMLAGCASGLCGTIAQDAAVLFGVVAGSLASGIAIAYIAVLTSAVPIAGTAPMVAYAAFLVMATVFLVKAIEKLREMEACLAVPVPATSSTVFLTGVVALGLTVIGFVLYGLFSLGPNRTKDS